MLFHINHILIHPKIKKCVGFLFFMQDLQKHQSFISVGFFFFKEILGGPHAAEQHYDGEFFKRFRNQNIVLSARTYARVLRFILLERNFVLVLLFSLKCIFPPFELG